MSQVSDIRARLQTRKAAWRDEDWPDPEEFADMEVLLDRGEALAKALEDALARPTEHEIVDVAAAFHEWLKQDDPYALTRAVERLLRDRRDVAEAALAAWEGK